MSTQNTNEIKVTYRDIIDTIHGIDKEDDILMPPMYDIHMVHIHKEDCVGGIHLNYPARRNALDSFEFNNLEDREKFDKEYGDREVIDLRVYHTDSENSVDVAITLKNDNLGPMNINCPKCKYCAQSCGVAPDLNQI